MDSLKKYNWLKIKSEIVQFSKSLNIDKIGFASAEPFYNIEELLREHRDRGYSSGFEEKDIMLRIDPQLSLPGVRSIIAVALAYPCQEPNNFVLDKEPRGMFCRASWGKDYHLVLREKLSQLANFIKTLVPEAATLAMVDTGPLSDRAVAARAGLGWIGKNGSLITEEYGSFVYLGELLTNLTLEPDHPVKKRCDTCSKCVNLCPMQAIIEDSSTVNCQKCLAFQTLTKGFLNDEIKNKIASHRHLYGCDICQLVCPFNKGKINDWHAEFKPRYELINPSLKKILKMSNKDFKKIYGQMSGSWRGKKILQRNALLILGEIKDPDTIPLLTDILNNDPRPEIRGAAAWALGKYNLEETFKILANRLEKEEDEQVKKEINNVL
ncbi:MAG: epoxyqueuosine reductase [Clostridia bacterium]|nr:epoxyqueuosine reductase [Clostridia bacterium]